MKRDSVAKLRLDRRLLHRRGWLTAEERERELAALPDVSHKATTLGAADRSDSGEGTHEGTGAGDSEALPPSS